MNALILSTQVKPVCMVADRHYSMWGVELSSYTNRNKKPLALSSDTFMNCDK